MNPSAEHCDWSRLGEIAARDRRARRAPEGLPRIGSRPIGRGCSPYIIAELGVNHDGSVSRALQLTRAAAAAGADAIKLQLFDADLLMSSAAKLAVYQESAGETDPIEMLRRLELSAEGMGEVMELAHQLRIHALVSVFSACLVQEADRLPWDGYKVASPDIINKPLLEALVVTGKPLIVSTGASTLSEVVRAVNWLEASRERLCLLQCVSSYPTPTEHLALGGIIAIEDATGIATGYSDHSVREDSGALAAKFGACILEKHLTLDRAAPGPDHATSLDPAGFARYVEYTRQAFNDLRDLPRIGLHGGANLDQESTEESMRAYRSCLRKEVLPIEQDVRAVSRQSLVTNRVVQAGHIITRQDLTIKRPGTGIAPFELENVIGCRATRTMGEDVPLAWSDIQQRGVSAAPSAACNDPGTSRQVSSACSRDQSPAHR